MKYYIEVWGRRSVEGMDVLERMKVDQGVQVLREYSRVCEDWDYDWNLYLVLKRAGSFAEKVVIYTHGGLNNSGTIKLYWEILWPEKGSP